MKKRRTPTLARTWAATWPLPWKLAIYRRVTPGKPRLKHTSTDDAHTMRAVIRHTTFMLVWRWPAQ